MSTLGSFADTVVKIGKNDIQNLPVGTANDFLVNALNLIYLIAGIVAVIVIIVAGFLFTTSVGEASAIAKAKNAILYSVIGLVVVAMAFVITQFVAGRF